MSNFPPSLPGFGSSCLNTVSRFCPARRRNMAEPKLGLVSGFITVEATKATSPLSLRAGVRSATSIESVMPMLIGVVRSRTPAPVSALGAAITVMFPWL